MTGIRRAGVNGIGCLTDNEKRLLNQIRGNSYCHIFAFVEEYIVPLVIDRARADVYGDETRLWSLLRFAEEEVKHQEMPGIYYSYLGYGIAKVRGQKQEGLKLCEHAVQLQFYEAENHWNLARVRLLLGDRKGAVRAANNGTRLDPQHIELAEMRRELGLRRDQVFPQLARDHALNKFFGQLRHALFGTSKS